MKKAAIVLFTVTTLALCLPVQADSNKHKQSYDQGDHYQQSQSNGQSKNKNKSSKQNKHDDDDEYEGKHGKKHDYHNNYDKDYSDIEHVFKQHKGKYSGYQSLPPGIAKNLQRGKPMPPGIAKQFDADTAKQLPYYPGYEWQRAGTDAVLINTTNQLVEEVMRGVLQP